MVRYYLVAALYVLALTSCAPTDDTATEADKIAAGVEATLEARRIETAISATLEAIATSTPIPAQRTDEGTSITRSETETSWSPLATVTGSHKAVSTGPSPVDAERAALVSLFEATDGWSWNLRDNWLSEEPVGEWFGVTTDSNGLVIELHLRYNVLRGEMPPELGNLTNLRILSLGATGLSGEIPSELGNLTNLVELWLWGNELSGEIPPELGSLANLEVLDLSRNQLQGEIPEELGNLAMLEQARLWDNELSGKIPPELGSLANLETLGLSLNQSVRGDTAGDGGPRQTGMAGPFQQSVSGGGPDGVRQFVKSG